MWNKFLDKLNEEEHKTKEFKEIITVFMIPDKISPIKFMANYQALSLDEIDSMIFGEENDDNVQPSPSFKKLPGVINRSPYWPNWFLAGYPDVANWIMAKLHQDPLGIMKKLGYSAEKMKAMDPNNSQTTNHFLRAIIDLYRSETNNDLECIN
jgi:hypothetical protein